MKSDDLKERSQSILGTEDAETPAQPLDEKKTKMSLEERKKVRYFALTAGISLLVVAAVFAVGAVVGSRVQKEEAAREPREETPVFSAALEEDERKENDITSAITEAYYTASNGMMVTIEFFNDTDTDEHISKVIATLCTEEGDVIAKAQSAGMKSDFAVPAGGTNEITMYIKPEYVSITDDLLETLQYEITVEHEAVA